ncbi:MAG TPA: lysophospholipid acyltransferase family protein [Anaeromyxobacteraceae bacterium]|nr:lysophospholipid acyltransferase family protein [Anaeromyxobacteraceae bacterium]
MKVAFSLLYWLYAIVSIVVLFVAMLPLWLLTAPFDRRRVVIHLYSCAWGYMYVAFNPLWRTRFEGRQKLPWNGPAVLVANHLSLVDILVLYGLFRPFKWVAKGELFRVPFVGWNMVLNDYVRIWRGDRESVRRMMEHCREHLSRGAPVMIFPEGTRSRDGRMLPFKDGAFKLAAEAGCPLIPIAISGSQLALPKHGIIFRQRATIRVRVLDPIDPKAYASTEELKAATRKVIEANVAELAAQPTGGRAGGDIASPTATTSHAGTGCGNAVPEGAE